MKRKSIFADRIKSSASGKNEAKKADKNDNNKNSAKSYVKKAWNFLWFDDSIWSFLLNVIIAFVIIKFLIYPGLGLILGTHYPIVAVISSSMEHKAPFDEWWQVKQFEYANYGISLAEFKSFPFQNGLNKGDIVILSSPKNAKVGDIIVFRSDRPDPIIHRAVLENTVNGTKIYQTQGDNNNGQLPEEKYIPHDKIIGKAAFRIPYVGYVKIFFSNLLHSITG